MVLLGDFLKWAILSRGVGKGIPLIPYDGHYDYENDIRISVEEGVRYLDCEVTKIHTAISNDELKKPCFLLEIDGSNVDVSGYRKDVHSYSGIKTVDFISLLDSDELIEIGRFFNSSFVDKVDLYLEKTASGGDGVVIRIHTSEVSVSVLYT